MSEVKRLPRIIRQCMTIGMLPTSYKVSLTYEGQLMWFCNFLENEVIPVVNNNSAVVEELKNYFENLDVQDEIDNKLEEMAESGELSDIIAQYLELAGILAFNTTADLKAATNLANGSFAKTYGNLVYSDGQVSFYKIRTLINTDVIDEDTLLALTNYPGLVAEKIPEKINLFQTKKPLNMNKVIFIGDSYSILPNQNTWVDYVKLRLGLTSSDYILKGEGSTGFQNYNTTTNHRFIDLLEMAYNESANPNDVTHIIVCGGANDIKDAYTTQSISEYISNFIVYAGSHFPNAKVYIGHIGFTIDTAAKRNLSKTLEAYSNCYVNNGAIYLKGVENVIHYYPYFLTNGVYSTSNTVHPNQAGSSAIGNAIYEALIGGYANCFRNWELLEDNKSIERLYSMQNNDTYKLKLGTTYRNLLGTPTNIVCNPSQTIEICEFTGGCVGGYELNTNRTPYKMYIQKNADDSIVDVDGFLTLSSVVVEDRIRQSLVFHPLKLDPTASGSSGYYQVEAKALYFPPFEIDLDYSEC